VPGVTGEIDSNAWAAYAELNDDFTDRLRFTGGARFSTEERTFKASRPVAPAGQARDLDTSQRWSAWTPRASMRYALTDNANVYATYSRGFKSGTYNVSAFSAVPVNPEYVDAIETGLKFSKHGVSVNGAIFHYDYRDIQVQGLTPGTGFTTLLNAAQADIKGAEVELSARWAEHLSLQGGMAYTRARYTEFPNALLTIPKTTTAACRANTFRPCGNIQGPGDASGNEMIRTPELSGNLGVTYEQPLANGRLQVNGSIYYNGGFFWEAGNRLRQDAYTTLAGRVSWTPASARYRVSMWGRNLTDELYALYVVDTTAADAVAYARPLSVGVSLDVYFH
jgi:iron complex outermembrane receptor protein